MTHPNSIILTYTGRRIDLASPKPSDICLADISHQLGGVNRFTGSGIVPIPTAQHCVHVSYLCPIELAQWGLLHDAEEAYLNDLSSPLKSLLLEYRTLGRLWHSAISERFGVAIVDVKYWDIQSMLTERHHNGPFGMTDQDWLGLPPGAKLPPIDPAPGRPWSAEEAERNYLARAKELGVS
jgi:hypothetical protein